MQILALNHVGLHVLDLERSRRFYAQVLGLEPLSRPNFDFPGAWFRLSAGQELHLIAKDAGGDASTRDCHFSLQVEDIKGAAAWLAGLGVRFQGPRERPDGARQVKLCDPDGHVLELIELTKGTRP